MTESDVDAIRYVWAILEHDAQGTVTLSYVSESAEEAESVRDFLTDSREHNAERYEVQKIRLGLPPSFQSASIHHLQQEGEELYYVVEGDEWVSRFYLTPDQAEKLRTRSAELGRKVLSADQFTPTEPRPKD